MNLKQDIDRLFKEGMSNHSATPPDFVWAGINENLRNNKLKRIKKTVYGVAVSIAILLSFSAGYFLNRIDPNSNNIVKVQNEKTVSAVKKTMSRATVTNKQTTKTVAEIPKKPQIAHKTTLPVVNKPTPIIKREEKSEFIDIQKLQLLKEEKNETILLASIDNNHKPVLKQNDINILNENTEFINMDEYKLPESEVKKQLWSVGMTAAPLVSYRKTTNDIEQLNGTTEKPLTSYSVGMNVRYKVAKRWKIQSGVYMSEMGQISNNVVVNKQPSHAVANKNTYDINTSAGNIQVEDNGDEVIGKLAENNKKPTRGGIDGYSSDIQADFVQNFEYIEVPLLINYNVINRKVSMNISGGVSTNFLYNSYTYIEDNDKYYNLNSRYDNMKNVNYSGVVGIELEYPIVTRLNFNLQPTFRYSLNSITDNSQKVYPYSFGIYTGLRYSF
jgi:hypothetical protein